MKAKVEVWHGDRQTFSQEYRSTVSARRVVVSRLEDCFAMGLTITLSREGEWWVFTCEREGYRHQIKMNPGDVPVPPEDGKKTTSAQELLNTQHKSRSSDEQQTSQ